MTMSREQLDAARKLFTMGDITWLLHPKQLELYNWLNEEGRDLAVICTSRQIGKSFMMLAYAINYCLQHPKQTVLYLAPTMTQLEKIILPRLNTIMQWLPDGLLPQTREARRWLFDNGSIFRLDGVGRNRGVAVRGDSIALAIIDEARDITHLQELIGAVIAPMLTTTDGKLIIISSAPDSPAHAFTDIFIRQAVARGDFFSLTYQDNPMLSSKRLTYLTEVLYPGGHSNATFRREYMADYTVTDYEKRVVREWNQVANDRFFESYAGPAGPVRAYIGLDSGWSDPAAVITGWWDATAGALVIDDEWMERHKNTAQIGRQIVLMEEKLMAKLPKGSPEPLRIMDVDPTLMHDLHSLYNLKFEPVFKVNSSIAMMNRLRISIAEGKVKIAKHCPQLRFQLETGVFNAKHSDYVRTEKTGHLDLVESLKGVVLNCRFNEVLHSGNIAPLGPNQMRLSRTFGIPGSFKQGVLQRPT